MLYEQTKLPNDMKAKLLHLLALLISVKVMFSISYRAPYVLIWYFFLCRSLNQRDDPSAIATAVALCQSARHGTAISFYNDSLLYYYR